MEKLSKSQKSKSYLESKTGVQSEALSEEVQSALTEAGKVANEKIARNNRVYQQSNSRSHLYSVEGNSEKYDDEENIDNSKDSCILATDFSIVDKHMQIWQEERERKNQVSQYILYLERLLECENDSLKKYLIEKEIKKLKKQQENYRVPSILEMNIYSKGGEESQDLFVRLIKKIKR